MQHQHSNSLLLYLQPEGVGPDGAIITRTVMIDGQRTSEPTRTETIRHVTMPTEIITKTITIEGDGTPLTAQELRDIMAQQAGDGLVSEQVVTRVIIKQFIVGLSVPRAAVILSYSFCRDEVI